MAYPGGKGRMRQLIISLMPPHRVYIETHLGGGAVMRAKRPASVNIGIDVDPEVAAGWRGPFPIDLVVGDAGAFLDGYPFQGDELVYCDPPYLPSSRRRRKVYRFDYDQDDHRALLDRLRLLRCLVVLSGYRSSLYDARLSDWWRTDSLQRTQAGVAVESVWTNFPPPAVLHDHGHLGADFREREAVRRRRSRIAERISGLPARERSALLMDLARSDREVFLAIAESVR